MPDIMPWHKTQLLEPDYNRVDLVKEGANSQAKIKLFKSRGGTGMNPEEILKGLKPEHQATMEAFIKAKDDAVADAETKKTTAEAKAKKLEDDAEEAKKNPFAKSKTEDMTQEEILKSVQDPAVRAFLETQIAKTKVAEDEIKKAREIALDAEAISKAKEVPNLGAEETVLSSVYKKLKTIDADTAEEVFGIFKAASALVAEGGVFTEVGKNSDGSVIEGEDAAWDKIQAKANDIAKERNISNAQAISKTISENPDLYNAYLKAQNG